MVIGPPNGLEPGKNFQDHVSQTARCAAPTNITNPFPEYRSVDQCISPKCFGDLGTSSKQAA